MSFQLSPDVDKNKVFLVERSELRGRLDPAYNLALIKSKISSCFPKYKMGRLCKSLTGGTPSKANPTFWTGSIPWISPKDMKSFYLSDAIDHITEKAVEESSTNIVPKNSVLIVVRSGILKHTIPISITNREMAINQDIKALIFNESVLPAYPAYFIDVYQSKLLPLIVKHSTTVQSINTEQFNNLKIPIPPKEIQGQIVAKMDTAYAAKKQKEAEAQRLLDNIDDYLLGELGIELPDQEENTIQRRIFVRRLSEVSGGRFDPESQSPLLQEIKSIFSNKLKVAINHIYRYPTFYGIDYLDKGIKVIKGESINKNGEIAEAQEFDYISTETHNKFFKTHIGYDDLIFTVRGVVGKVGIYKSKAPANINANVIMIRINKSYHPEFIWSYLNSKVAQILIGCLTSGQVQKTITVPDIQNIPIPDIEIRKQEEIANHITEIRNQAKQLQQQSKAELEQAKKDVEAMILGKDECKA